MKPGTGDGWGLVPPQAVREIIAAWEGVPESRVTVIFHHTDHKIMTVEVETP